MKTSLLPFFILLCLPALAQENAEEQIHDLEVKRSAAIAAHDKAFLSELYDDAFHGVTALGKVLTKHELLEVLDTNNPHVTFTTEDMKVVVHGEAAVFTGKLVSLSKTGTVLGQTRFIHIYVKRADSWKIVEGQATVIH